MDNTDDLIWRICELYNQKSNEREFWNDIVEQITKEYDGDYSKDKVRGLWRRNKDRYADEWDSGIVSSSDESIVNTEEIVGDALKDETIDDFIKRRKIDLEMFSIVEATVNEYAGNEQIKLRLRPKVERPFNQQEFLERIESVIKNFGQNPPIAQIEFSTLDQDDEYLFVPVLFDAHIDSPKFDGDYVKWLGQLIQMGVKSGYRPTRILFVIGNDFGHIDNNKYETTNGTLVGSKRTYLDSVDERCRIILESCNLLRSYVPKLDLLFVQGNHDAFSTYWLGKVVESYYRGDGNVTVLNGQSPRKYYRYGKNLFGFTHGNEERKFDLASLMAVESPLDWAASENRVWLTGHLHQQNRMYNMLNEKFGVIQRIFPSLVPSDDWHILKGYIGNARAAELLVYGQDGKKAEFQLSIG